MLNTIYFFSYNVYTLTDYLSSHAPLPFDITCSARWSKGGGGGTFKGESESPPIMFACDWINFPFFTPRRSVVAICDVLMEQIRYLNVNKICHMSVSFFSPTSLHYTISVYGLPSATLWSCFSSSTKAREKKNQQTIICEIEWMSPWTTHPAPRKWLCLYYTPDK